MGGRGGALKKVAPTQRFFFQHIPDCIPVIVNVQQSIKSVETKTSHEIIKFCFGSYYSRFRKKSLLISNLRGSKLQHEFIWKSSFNYIQPKAKAAK